MNGFDVEAVGWLVTRDLGCDAVSAWLRLKPAMPRRAAEALFRQWQTLSDAVDQDVAGQTFETRLLAPRRVRLSARSEAAMRAFLDGLAASHPERYAAQALRGRCAIASAQTAASVLCCFLFGYYASPDTPTLGQAALAFLLVGLWYLATTVQLLRACRLIRVLSGTPLPACKQHGTQPP